MVEALDHGAIVVAGASGGRRSPRRKNYSTVTDLAKLRG
jgi:hypothetical protein